MGGALLAIEQAADRVAFHHHPLAHLGDGVGQQGIERGGRLAAEFDQFVFGGGAGGGDRHGILGYGRRLCAGCDKDTTRAVHKSKVARNWRVSGPFTRHRIAKLLQN